MEGGGSVGGGGGGLYAAQEPQKGEEEKAGRQPRAGGCMKFRVAARAQHGVGALLLIGGAVLAGAAAVAWRHARRGRRPAKREVAADGRVVEDGKSGASALETDQPDDKVQGGAEIDLPDENLTGEEETEIESNGLGNGRVTQEIQEVHDDAEIVEEGSIQNSEHVEKIDLDLDLGKGSTEIAMHDDDEASEHVEKYDENPSTELPEPTEHDKDIVTVVEKVDDNNPTNKDTGSDHILTENDTGNDQDPVTDPIENENSSKNDAKKEIIPIDNECVEASDSTSRPGIVLAEQRLVSVGAQEAESMENSPTAKLVMQQDELLDDTTTDAEGETSEAELEKGAVLDKDAPKQGQEKATAEPVGLAGSPLPAPSSLVIKPTEKKEPPELPGRVEAGMKMEQDYTDGERGLIGKGGAVVTVDRRSASVAILALMFALAIGITIVVRLYAPPRAAKLEMNL